MRIAASASSAAWLLPTRRYLACSMSAIALVQPHRCERLRAGERLRGRLEGARKMFDREIGSGQAADEAHRRDALRQHCQGAEHVLMQRARVPAEAHRTV